MFLALLPSILGFVGMASSQQSKEQMQQEQLQQQMFLNQQNIMGQMNQKKNTTFITIGVVLIVIAVVYFAMKK